MKHRVSSLLKTEGGNAWGVQSTWATVEVNECVGRVKSGWER